MIYEDNDLTGNLVLDPDEKPHYQFLLASQNYGTMYGIYAKFILDKIGEEKFISKIELSLINYKGIMDIGLCLNANGKIDMHVKKLDKNTLQLKVPVQGLNNTLNAEGDLAPYEGDKINISEIHRIEIQRELHRLSTNSGSTEANVFDNEFYYRDGIDSMKHPERTLRPGMKNHISDENIKQSDKLIGTNCHTSRFIVYPRPSK